MFLKITDLLEPNYFNQDFVESSLLITESIEQCKNECQKDFDCPYFSYFTATDEITNINANSCIIYENGINLQTAVNKYKNSSVFALISNPSLQKFMKKT
jgi:hypothetical protein